MALPKYTAHAAMALAAVGVLYYLRKLPAQVQQAGQQALKPVTDGVWSLWESVRPYTAIGAFNPVQYPEFTSAGFYLNSKYVSPSYKLSSQFIQSMELAHKGNAALMNKLLDSFDVIKPQYRHLINNEISEITLNA